MSLYPNDGFSSAGEAKDLVLDYWSVPADDDEISINKYKIGGKWGGKTAELQNKEIQHVYDVASTKRLGPRSGPFGRAKEGKASPEDFEHIFDMGLRSGALKAGGLQNWADTNLGVDCTGFTVAYLDSIDMMSLTKYGGGAGCPFILQQATLAARKNKIASALIWDLDDVEEDDLILWMYDNGQETRQPGHISVVYQPCPNLSLLRCAESSGEPDEKGHSGPRLKERIWKGVRTLGSKKYIDLNGAQVIIVRLYDSIG